MLGELRLRKEFLGGVGAEEKRVVQRFVAGNAEGMLKTRPKVRARPFHFRCCFKRPGLVGWAGVCVGAGRWPCWFGGAEGVLSALWSG